MDIEAKVFLLAIYKKKEDEDINDILLVLEDAGMFTLKGGKKVLKSLRQDGYVDAEALTFTGIAKAKEAEKEFTL